MATSLETLSPQQKIAALQTGLAVIASMTNGRVRSNDPDVITLVRGIFGHSADESSSPEILMCRVREALDLDRKAAASLLAGLSNGQQIAIKSLLMEISHDNVIRAITAGTLLKEAGFGVPPGAESFHPQKEDIEIGPGTFVQITDIEAVRGECSEVFNVFEEDPSLDAEKIEAGYDAWLKAGLCPREGMVGVVGKVTDSPEGKLYFIAVEKIMVIPMLDFGIESIDRGTYERFRQNNLFHAYDPERERCRKLRATPKTVKKKVRKPAEMGKKTINVMTNIFRRFEKGVQVADEYIKRLIILEYSDYGRLVDITVHKDMQTKHACLVNDNGSVLVYKDTELPTFARYEVETGPDNETIRVSIFMGDTEYRYLI